MRTSIVSKIKKIVGKVRSIETGPQMSLCSSPFSTNARSVPSTLQTFTKYILNEQMSQIHYLTLAFVLNCEMGGSLAGSVGGEWDSCSQSCEFETHTACRAYLIRKIKQKTAKLEKTKILHN